LKLLSESGNFRKDLYFRLQTHRVEVPPLRERREDIAPLLEYFLDEAAEMLQKKRPSIPRELVALLKSYHFPGNVRELRSMVVDAVTHHGGGVLSMARFKEHVQHLPVLGEITSRASAGVTLVRFFPR